MTDRQKKINLNDSNVEIGELFNPASIPENGDCPEKDPSKRETVPQQEILVLETDKERRNLLMSLSAFRLARRHGEYLSQQMGMKLDPKSLSQKTNEELRALIEDCKYYINAKNSNNFIETGVITGLNLAERILEPYYTVKGMTQVLCQDPVFLDIVEELQLNNLTFVRQDPSLKLMYTVLKTAFLIHEQHKSLQNLSEEGREKLRKMFSKDLERELIRDVPKSFEERNRDLFLQGGNK